MLSVIAGLIVSGIFGEVNPNPGGSDGLFVNLADIQWWQGIGAAIVLLGISPAPWITALATGRLLFRADLERQLKNQTTEHEKALAERDKNHSVLLEERDKAYDRSQEALKTEQGRNEKLTGALTDSTEALRVMNHALTEFNEVAKRATE